MKDEYIREGETFEITFTDTDLTADTVTMTISNDTGVIAQDTFNYSEVNGKMVATVKILDPLLVLGEYRYMYTILYSSGKVDKLPDVSNCDGGCELPRFIVCEANDI